jgi:DnaJ-domain-containing protein 1
MTDYFAMLDEARCPWLDPDRLKAKFLQRCAVVHPDRVHSGSEAERQAAGRTFSELNAAYNVLREPRDRLRHLLELETGRKPAEAGQVPTGLADLFFELGTACRRADGLAAERAKSASPMLRAQLFERGLEPLETLRELQSRVAARQEELGAELKAMTAGWNPAAADWPRLEQICQALGYLGRWQSQIQERITQLSI